MAPAEPGGGFFFAAALPQRRGVCYNGDSLSGVGAAGALPGQILRFRTERIGSIKMTPCGAAAYHGFML